MAMLEETEIERARFLRRLAWATIVPVGMLLVAMVLKPMWRDEFWSLYFTEPRFSLAELLGDRMRYETHPPLYFVFLRLWRGVSDNMIWIRSLAAVFLIVGVFGAYWFGRGRRDLGLFLMMCAGSYWVIYFVTEARPYTLLFVLCAWSTLIAAQLLDKREGLAWRALAFAIAGALAGLSHYFGALWTGCFGLAIGVALLAQKRFGAFFAIGAASIVAVLPLIAWLIYSMPMLGERGGNPPPGPDEWQVFLTQMSRGLTVKLLGSNLALTAAVFAGIAALMRRRDAVDRVILGAALLFIAVSAALDLLYSPMIKERSFTPMIPALILVMARAVLSVDPARPWARRLLFAAPILAALSPFLFIPEYFKDREKLGELREYVRIEGGQCAGATIVAYTRERWGNNTFQHEVISRELRNATGGAPPRVIATTEVSGPIAASPQCRIRGMALLMPPGDRDDHAVARDELRRAGLDMDRLEEVRFGKGRNILWVDPETPR